MQSDNNQEIWPPAPGFGYGPPAKAPRFRWMLGWIGPVLSGIAGAVAGAILLPVILLALIFLTNDPDGPLGFLFVLVAAIVIGAGIGFVCGVAAWFVGRAGLRWWLHWRKE